MSPQTAKDSKPTDAPSDLSSVYNKAGLQKPSPLPALTVGWGLIMYNKGRLLPLGPHTLKINSSKREKLGWEPTKRERERTDSPSWSFDSKMAQW